MRITKQEYRKISGTHLGAASQLKIPRAPSAGEESLALQLKDAGIKFHREFRFCPERKWRFDFAVGIEHGCIAIEIEGATWVAGRHTRGSSIEKDFDKYNEASVMGWRVLHFTTQQAMDGKALETIKRAIA